MRDKKQRGRDEERIDKEYLHERMSSDRCNRIVFNEGKKLSLYLVGGYLRDTLLGRESFDRDFAVAGNYRGFLVRVSKKTGGKLVKIGNDLDRIVLGDASTLDFTRLTGSIDADLTRRDFSINSIAWSPASGIIDRHGGITDLRIRKVRTVRQNNLSDDPVRLIRAFRFASELSLGIDPETRRAIRELAGHIVHGKSERITLEFFKILNLDAAAKAVSDMLNDGVLKHLIFLSNSDLRHKLRVLSRLDRIFNVLPLKYFSSLENIYSQGLLRRGLIRLEVLLKGVSGLNRFALSRKILKSIRKIEEGELLFSDGCVTLETLFDVFMQVGEEASHDLLIIAGRPDLLSQYERYRRIMKNGLLSTKDVIAESGISQGEMLGMFIEHLKKAQFEGSIKGRREAISLLKKLRCNLT